jgi:Protein of unknown function (DUF2868)
VRGGRLGLGEVFDVELQLLRDAEVSGEELRRRDRRIGLAIGADQRAGAGDAGRHSLLNEWVRAVQKEEARESVGERIVRARDALAWLLVVLGLSSGVGAATTVLAYDGERPVNVVHFLAVFVALQILLLILFAVSATLWRFRDRLPAVNGLYGLVRVAFHGLASLFDRRLSAERRGMLRAARGRLRSSHIIYGDVERWLLVSLAQRFGLAFNLGALGSCLYLVAFSDLAFAWQSTLSWTAEDFHRAISALAAPWSWAYPDGLPSIEVVRASRYFRLDGSFGDAPSPSNAALLGEWWRFLVSCLVVYGLVPRLLLSIYAGARLRAAMRSLRLDHGQLASVLERLTSPIVRTQSPTPELAPPDATSAPLDRPGPAAAADQMAAVVIWGDVPIEAADVTALVARRFGWQVRLLERAGVDDTRQDAAAIEAAAGQGERAPVLIVVEAFESPTREVRAFVHRMREAIGAQRHILVGLLDSDGAGRWSAPAGDSRRIWTSHMAGLGDPYLRVEAVVEDA